jgi:hypothetical protein
MADMETQHAGAPAGGGQDTDHATTARPTDPLNHKILEHLGDRVILKPLTRWNEAYKEFPRYVMEYLVSRYVDPDACVAGQAKIDKILSEHYAESAKKELIKSRIKEKGQYPTTLDLPRAFPAGLTVQSRFLARGHATSASRGSRHLAASNAFFSSRTLSTRARSSSLPPTSQRERGSFACKRRI